MRLTTFCSFILFCAFFAVSAPVMAQSTSKSAISSPGTHNSTPTGAQSMHGSTGGGTILVDTKSGTLGPQSSTVIPGFNSAGTVRVQNLANLEALTNIIANGVIILGIAWGGPAIIMGFYHMSAGTQDGLKRVIWGMCSVTGGMATPGAINWLVASGKDAGLFQ
jgi:hypothetical protein